MVLSLLFFDWRLSGVGNVKSLTREQFPKELEIVRVRGIGKH